MNFFVVFKTILCLLLFRCCCTHGFPQSDSDSEEDSIPLLPEDDLTEEEQAELKAILKEIIAERLQEHKKSGRKNATAADVVLEILEHAKGETKPESVTKSTSIATTTEFDLLAEVFEYANKNSSSKLHSQKNQTATVSANSDKTSVSATKRPRPPYISSSFPSRPGFANRVTNFLREQYIKGNIPTSLDEFAEVGERITKFGEDTYDAIVYVECDVLDLPTC